ncbi:MAG: S41 family peptidase [Verrucomicrobiota bacterium]
MVIEDGRLIVLSNETADNQTVGPGMELLEINGHTVPELLRRFERVESSDGAIQTSKWVHIQRGFAMYYWFLVEQPESFSVKSKDAKGQLLEAKLAGLTREQSGKSDNPVNAPLRAGMKKIDWTHEDLAWRFIKQTDVAELRIRSFNGDNFPGWVEATFKALSEQRTKTLIIDLRGNGGGPDMHGALLVSYLVDKPFRYFDHITAKTIDPSFKAQADWSEERTRELSRETTPRPTGGYQVKHAALAEQMPGKYPFHGKVIVLIDGGVFSTAADFCAISHHLGRATFVGEETGGGYCGNNSGAFAHVTLPNSHFQIRLPLYGYWNAVAGNSRRGTLPNHQVLPKVESLLHGVDEPLEMALRLAASP